jgi:hypothetical protein
MLKAIAVQGQRTGGDPQSNAAIEVRDQGGTLRADVYVECRADGKVFLVITDRIVERDSDDATAAVELLVDRTHVDEAIAEL